MTDVLRFFRFPGDDGQYPQSWIKVDLSDLDIPGWGGTAMLSLDPIDRGALILSIEELTIENVKNNQSGPFYVVFEHGRWDCSNPTTFKVHKEAITQIVDNMIALCYQNQEFLTWYLDALVDMFTVDLTISLELEQDYMNYQQSHDYSLGGTRTADIAAEEREASEAEIALIRKDIREFEEFIAQGKLPITNEILNKSLMLIKNGLEWSDAFKIGRTL
jgi:hypothetical protein